VGRSRTQGALRHCRGNHFFRDGHDGQKSLLLRSLVPSLPSRHDDDALTPAEIRVYAADRRAQIPTRKLLAPLCQRRNVKGKSATSVNWGQRKDHDAMTGLKRGIVEF